MERKEEKKRPEDADIPEKEENAGPQGLDEEDVASMESETSGEAGNDAGTPGNDSGHNEEASTVPPQRRKFCIRAMTVAGGVLLFAVAFTLTTVLSPRCSAEDPKRGRAAEDILQMADEHDYEEWMEIAIELRRKGDSGESARIFRHLMDDFVDEPPKHLYAMYKLSKLLLENGRFEEAGRMAENIAAAADPNSELWKNSMLLQTTAAFEGGKAGRFYTSGRKLRANTGRYEDQDRLNKWLSYIHAMQAVSSYQHAHPDRTAPFGIEEPVFGGRRPDFSRIKLADVRSALEESPPPTAEYALQMRDEKYTLRACHAPLQDVLAELTEVADLRFDYEDDVNLDVTADFRCISAQSCLKILAGAAGLRALQVQDDLWVLEPSEPEQQSYAFDDAVWAVQDFVIAYPASELLCEAYFALAYLSLMNRDWGAAADRFSILLEKTPQSSWAQLSYYLRGCVNSRRGRRGDAQNDFESFIDHAPDHALRCRAFYLLGRSLMEGGKYNRAAASFHRALTPRMGPEKPEILFNIAYCIEKSGAAVPPVKERYLRLITLAPFSEYTRKAYRRIGDMMRKERRLQEAVRWYGEYLQRWDITDGEEAAEVAAALFSCYTKRRQWSNAALLYDTLASAGRAEGVLAHLMPEALKAARKAGMVGLTEDWFARSGHEIDDEAAFEIGMENVRLLLEGRDYRNALETLQALSEHARTRNHRDAMELLRGDILKAAGEEEKALEAWAKAASAEDASPRREALLRAGRYYEDIGEFEKAARAYGGEMP